MRSQQPDKARAGFSGRFGGNTSSSGRQSCAERSYSKTVQSHSGRDPSLQWLEIPHNVPENAIALLADVVEDWVRVMSEITAKDYGSDLAHGIRSDFSRLVALFLQRISICNQGDHASHGVDQVADCD
jgi:hypothetical protein